MPQRVSVVILSHRPALVGKALRSALRQTVPCQVLVQHDRDNYAGKIGDIARAARGEFLVPLCDDDLLHRRYVETCLRFAEYGDIIFTDRRMWWSGLVEWANWRSWVKRAPAIGHRHFMYGARVVQHLQCAAGDAIQVKIPWQAFAFGAPYPMTCLIRRSLWNDLSGYDETMPHADTEFWYRAVRRGARVVYVPQPLFRYRFHRAQISRDAATPPNGAAALAFHRKHFLDFGFAFTQRADDPTKYDCEVIPPDDRAEYLRRHGMKVA